jgi:hypothetical protein
MIEVGTKVIYRKTKYSRRPGPRAASITPARHGDSYAYVVEKYWLVVARKSPDEIIVQTRRGKRLTLNTNDVNLRAASFLDRLLYGRRFPSQ